MFVHDEAGIHKIDFWALGFTKRIFLAIGIHGVLRAFHVFLFFEFCKKKKQSQKGIAKYVFKKNIET